MNQPSATIEYAALLKDASRHKVSLLITIPSDQPLLQVAKVLADSVIPNEYGIDPEGKLKIGSKICTVLLGKILSDLQNMREESLITAVRASPLFPAHSASRPESLQETLSSLSTSNRDMSTEAWLFCLGSPLAVDCAV